MAAMAPSGTVAVTTGRSASPPDCAVVMSAPPNSSPRSDGLMGEASTRTSTSSAAGWGTATVSTDSLRVPSPATVE